MMKILVSLFLLSTASTINANTIVEYSAESYCNLDDNRHSYVAQQTRKAYAKKLGYKPSRQTCRDLQPVIVSKDEFIKSFKYVQGNDPQRFSVANYCAIRPAKQAVYFKNLRNAYVRKLGFRPSLRDCVELTRGYW